ncbi:hypothetical protein [Paenibacillus sp. OV219]|uniref:hypothetical protein n=1 Tax=Paenibacillus sp. OV219 TaxID=1884377 RepID=UPI0008D7570B|nr:hypothetical protein [Paenibacillus sp. OV219]SEN75615.1 hypothetical protein SAMN05518847_10460 [Paenibacillus sp. OV219]
MPAAAGKGSMKISKAAGARRQSISPAVKATGKQRKRTVKTGSGSKSGASRQRRLQRGRKRLYRGQSGYNRAFDQAYNQGYNLGFAKGFEDGHQLAYEQQP